MSKILFIADFFVEDVLGGGELCSQEVIEFLEKHKFEVKKVRSQQFTLDILKQYQDKPIIVSNFVGLSQSLKTELRSGQYKYIIIEHDWKFCKTRNPLVYKDLAVPEEDIINEDFYAKAQAVLTQSKTHAENIEKNLFIKNIVNLGCNLWSNNTLNEIEKRIGVNKIRKYGIMNSPNKIKGTKEAIELCVKNNLPYELIDFKDQKSFFDELAKTETFIFLPQSLESYSRVCMEAKMLGCKLITNKAIGVMSENYWELNGKKLINEIRRRKQIVLNTILGIINSKSPEQDELFKFFKTSEIEGFFIKPLEYPKVSLITTVYKGEKFIDGYLDAFAKQNYPGPLQLVMVEIKTEGGDEDLKTLKKIYDLKQKYENLDIRYYASPTKITTAEAFNLATSMATGEYVSTVLIDDRIAPHYVKTLAKHLYLDKTVDLVYGDTLVSTVENEAFENTTSNNLCEYSLIPFSKENMVKNVMGCMPMYRKTAHERVGGYDEKILHGTDWEFALKLVKTGSSFKKINKVVGLYYNNPNGLSTSKDEKVILERRKSEREIFEKYKELYPENYKVFKPYFDQYK